MAKNIRPSQLELYVEFPNVHRDDNELFKIAKGALLQCFGFADVERSHEISCDKEDRGAILAWLVTPRLISSKLHKVNKRANSIKVKFYRKGERLRLEIQAHSPSMGTKSDDEQINEWKRLQMIGETTPELFIYQTMAVADELADALRKLERHLSALVYAPLAGSDLWRITFDEIIARTTVLLSRLVTNVNFIEFAEDLAKQGYTDRKRYKEYGLNPQNLNVLANDHFGFLVKQSKGVEGIEGRAVNNRNPNFVLDCERLKRTGRATKVREGSFVVPINEASFAWKSLTKRGREQTIFDSVKGLQGSAAVVSTSAFRFDKAS